MVAEIEKSLFEQQYFLANVTLAHGQQFAAVGFQGEEAVDFAGKRTLGGFERILDLPLFENVGQRWLQAGFFLLNFSQLRPVADLDGMRLTLGQDEPFLQNTGDALACVHGQVGSGSISDVSRTANCCANISCKSGGG